MKYIFFTLFPIVLFAISSFISPIEYAAQLYKNPRGIGCQYCHGERGEGRLIANYIHKNKKKSFRGAAIDTLSLDEFNKALNRRTDGMPRYYLTVEEIKALYLHLHPDDKEDIVDDN